MSIYLRDRYIKNLSLNDESIKSISDTLFDIASTTNQGLSHEDPNYVNVYYVIRFDSKGFILTDIESVLDYHRTSKKTERLSFSLDCKTSRDSNRNVGKSAQISLDKLDEDNCIFTVQDDDPSWTESTFCRIDQELAKYKNRNFLIRNAWTPFIIQILGVLAGFLLSLWATLKISPILSIEYSFAVTFVLAFLIFSNAWTYINQQILNFLDYIFPNIALKESRGLHWLGKAFVSAIFVAGEGR